MLIANLYTDLGSRLLVSLHSFFKYAWFHVFVARMRHDYEEVNQIKKRERKTHMNIIQTKNHYIHMHSTLHGEREKYMKKTKIIIKT